MTMLLGTNSTVVAEWEHVLTSPDIMAVQAQVFNAGLVQRRLTVPHVIGDGIFHCNDIDAFIGEHIPINEVRGSLAQGTAFIKPIDGGPRFGISWYGFSGQKWLAVTGITSGSDQNAGVGSLIENQRSNWLNPNGLDIYPPILNGGINTGVPSGLRSGQLARTISNPNVSYPVGDWTMMAFEGVGKLQFLHVNSGFSQTVNFENGVATNSDQVPIIESRLTGTWFINLIESDPTNPLNRFRFVCPGVASNGKTYVQNYIENKDNSSYFQYHEQYIRMHRNDRVNGIKSVRQVNGQGINRMNNPVTVREPSDLSPAIHCFGNKRPQEIPHEWIAEMSRAADVDLTWGINYRASDAFILWTANMLAGKLAPGRKARVAYANENWNDQYVHLQYQALQHINKLNRCSITRSGSTATVTKESHGFSNGETVIITGARQDEYNGEFLIGNVTANTFTYSVAGSPVSPATAYTDSEIFAYKFDTDLVKDVPSIVMDVSSASTRWVMTLPTGHGIVDGDFLSFSGFQDPRLNAVFRVSAYTATSANLTWIPGCRREPIETLPGMGQSVSIRSGSTLRYRRVLRNSVTSQDGIGIPSLKYATSRYTGTRSVEIHNIMRPVLGDRLIEVVEGHYASNYDPGNYNRVLLDTYRTANGGAYPPAMEFATAPYFNKSGLSDTALTAMATGGATESEISTAILNACQNHIAGEILTQINRQVAECVSRGIKPTFYECGQHILYALDNATVRSSIFLAQRSQRMGELTLSYLQQADACGVFLAHYYLICGKWDTTGYWGSMENQAQQDSPPPKYQAILDYLGPKVDPSDTQVLMYLLPSGAMVSIQV